MNAAPGRLILIGCGPGAADLLTLRAIRRIAEADVILRDRLVDEDVLAFASPAATVAYVGKAPGDGGVQQATIDATIRAALLEGKTVARLKSGDPMVFGRASEEIAAAVSAGAKVEIVPGVTSALAAAADAAIAVTERAEIQTFAVVTARAADADATPDWVSRMRPGVCLAFYMGVREAWKIQSTLMAAGVPADAPADWVENAGRPDVRTVPTSLGRLSLDARQNRIANPAILFVRYPLSLSSRAGEIPAAVNR